MDVSDDWVWHVLVICVVFAGEIPGFEKGYELYVLLCYRIPTRMSDIPSSSNCRFR